MLDVEEEDKQLWDLELVSAKAKGQVSEAFVLRQGANVRGVGQAIMYTNN